jgi:hypothetical protein
MRRIGIGSLGLIGGLLLAIVVQDVLARILDQGDGAPSSAGMILGSLLPVFGLLGAVLALWLDRRARSKDTTDE